ncbi:hypothetical protein L195_g032386, partial [Trifolium pratense]
MDIEACSKLWRWFEGIVPSGSKGWCRSGPMKSSIEIDAVVATMMMCHRPIIMKPKPEDGNIMGGKRGEVWI